MIHPFAIGATIKHGSTPMTVLGYIETPLGGRIVACLSGSYEGFASHTPIYHVDPAKCTEVAADPLVEIAERTADKWIHDPTALGIASLTEYTHAALIEARDAS